MHPIWRNDELIAYCNDHDIHVTAYCPLGMPWTSGKAVIRRADPARQHPVILEVAKKYKKDVTHIIMRWGLQHDTSIIAKSSNPCHIKVRNYFPSWVLTCTYQLFAAFFTAFCINLAQHVEANAHVTCRCYILPMCCQE